MSQSETSWKPATDPAVRNYPYNCWWVAAFSDEITRDLLGRWLLDTPVLLYRREDGTPVALENRCPHRGAPLSLGCLKGDEVQCGYHGFRFAADGTCVDIPTMKVAPSSANVRTFPLVEQAPYVWIYLGDPAAMDDVPPPPVLEWTTDSAISILHGRIDIAANYLLLKENVLDLTHFGYVHAKTFGITDWVDLPNFTTEGDTTGFSQKFIGSPLPPLFALPMGLPVGTPFDRDNSGAFVSPALQRGDVDFRDPATGEVTARLRIAHATTPISPTEMHYFWLVARDYGTAPEMMEELRQLTLVGFDEDKVIIEAIQQTASRDPRGTGAPEFSVKMDTAGIQARRIVQRWMDKETR
jgi:phenylpropionate dioxygenase-like ring-hydroxylating dioxygenase large terminal subunit